MKKAPNIVAYFLFTLGYVLFLSLGMASLVLWFRYGMTVSPDAREGPSYPHFLPFCVVVGVCAAVALLVLLIVNWLVAEDYGYTKEGWGLQAIIVFALSFCLTTPWMTFLEFLHKIF